MLTFLTASHKFELMTDFLPAMDARPWLQAVTRGKRLSIARLLTSQNRLPCEMGRWAVPQIPFEHRLCTFCWQLAMQSKYSALVPACRDAVECLCSTAECIGNERHFAYRCPITRTHWLDMEFRIQAETGIVAPSVERLLKARPHVTVRTWKHIGRELGRACEHTLNDAQRTNIVAHLTEKGDPRILGI